MNERRIEKRYEIDYRTDKKVKPCSEKTAKALEQYKEKQYISKLLLMAERNCKMTKRNLCKALDIGQYQFINYRDGNGIYPHEKKSQLEAFVAGLIKYNLNKT